MTEKNEFFCYDKKKKTTFIGGFSRAGKGTRTLDPDLGKVVLYQLSYSREGDPIIEIKISFVKGIRRKKVIFLRYEKAPQTRGSTHNQLKNYSFISLKRVLSTRSNSSWISAEGSLVKRLTTTIVTKERIKPGTSS